jgi:hypothetical protein
VCAKGFLLILNMRSGSKLNLVFLIEVPFLQSEGKLVWNFVSILSNIQTINLSWIIAFKQISVLIQTQNFNMLEHFAQIIRISF